MVQPIKNVAICFFLRKNNRKEILFDSIGTDSIFYIHSLLYSSNKKYLLTLLPELYILYVGEEEKKAICHWKLHSAPPEALGDSPRLEFNSKEGHLKLISTYDYIVWNSHPFESTRSFVPSEENKKYKLQLTDNGTLQILSGFKWERQMKIISWSSAHYATPIKDLTMAPNCLFYHNLRNDQDTCRIFFNQETGVLQIFQKKTTFQSRPIWQSHYIHQGTYPWFCVMTYFGILVILDSKRNVIWASNFFENNLQINQNPSACSTFRFLLSEEGSFSIQNEKTNQILWKTTQLSIPQVLISTLPHSTSKYDAEEQKNKNFKFPLTLEEVEEWFWCKYHLFLSRTCLIGNDYLLPHQLFRSLRDESFLHFSSTFSYLITFLLWLDNVRATLYLCWFDTPISIYSDNLQNQINNRLSLLQSKQKLEPKDYPCIVVIQEQCLYLSTFHGVFLDKIPISSLIQICQKKRTFFQKKNRGLRIKKLNNFSNDETDGYDLSNKKICVRN